MSRLRVLSRRLLTLLAVLAASASLWAQGDKAFVPLPAGQSLQEPLPATPLVFTAYAFVWVALLAYIFVLWQPAQDASSASSPIVEVDVHARQRRLTDAGHALHLHPGRAAASAS